MVLASLLSSTTQEFGRYRLFARQSSSRAHTSTTKNPHPARKTSPKNAQPHPASLRRIRASSARQLPEMRASSSGRLPPRERASKSRKEEIRPRVIVNSRSLSVMVESP